MALISQSSTKLTRPTIFITRRSEASRHMQNSHCQLENSAERNEVLRLAIHRRKKWLFRYVHDFSLICNDRWWRSRSAKKWKREKLSWNVALAFEELRLVKRSCRLCLIKVSTWRRRFVTMGKVWWSVIMLNCAALRVILLLCRKKIVEALAVDTCSDLTAETLTSAYLVVCSAPMNHSPRREISGAGCFRLASMMSVI